MINDESYIDNLNPLNPAVFHKIDLNEMCGIKITFNVRISTDDTANAGYGNGDYFAFFTNAVEPNENNDIDALNGYGILVRMGDTEGFPNVFVVDRPTRQPIHVIDDHYKLVSIGEDEYFLDGSGIYQHLAAFNTNENNGFYFRNGVTYSFEIIIGTDYALSVSISDGTQTKSFSSPGYTPINVLDYQNGNGTKPEYLGFSLLAKKGATSIGISNINVKIINFEHALAIIKFKLDPALRDNAHRLSIVTRTNTVINPSAQSVDGYKLYVFKSKNDTLYSNSQNWVKLIDIAGDQMKYTVLDIIPSDYIPDDPNIDEIIFALESKSGLFNIDYIDFYPLVESMHVGGRYDIFVWYYRPETVKITAGSSWTKLPNPMMHISGSEDGAADEIPIRFYPNLRGGVDETVLFIGGLGDSGLNIIVNKISDLQDKANKYEVVSYPYVRMYMPIVIHLDLYGDIPNLTKQGLATIMDTKSFNGDALMDAIVQSGMANYIDTTNSKFQIEYYDMYGKHARFYTKKFELDAIQYAPYLYRFYPGSIKINGSKI